MVDFNNDNSQTTATKTDLVCPVCFRRIDNPVIMSEGPDSEGHTLRTYFGYCCHCSAAHVVIQFARGDRWVIHKYRPAVVLGLASVVEISDDWKMMSEMPSKAADSGQRTANSITRM